ncbi:hypothetical protein NKH77_37945 [Streptomyces sp. M19]
MRWILALAVGVLWWWAVLRLILRPGDVGVVEGVVGIGGWGLGLLPVHCVPRRSGAAVARPPGGAISASGGAISGRGRRVGVGVGVLPSGDGRSEAGDIRLRPGDSRT